jgi:predicted metal-binding membrane protein
VEAASLRRAPAVPELIRFSLIGALLLLAAVGWFVTDERMAGMDMGPGTDPGTFGFWVSAWVVMMGAMMFPSIAPMVVMYVRIQRGKRAKGQAAPLGATAVFVAGYLLAWSTAGVVGYTILWAGHELSPGFLAWDEAGPYVAGSVILAAAAYQLTPLKDVCLRKCRDPFAFVLTAWKPGRTGALRMGLEHGGWCVGCCWALMAALIALGVMSVGWMVFVAALIAMEKLLPWKALANRSIATLLAVLGLAVAFAPGNVPGLTVPDEAMGSEMQPGPMAEPHMAH